MLTLGPKDKEWMDLVVALLDHEVMNEQPWATMAERKKEIDLRLQAMDKSMQEELAALDSLGETEMPKFKAFEVPGLSPS